jgi:hypothetical protein
MSQISRQVLIHNNKIHNLIDLLIIRFSTYRHLEKMSSFQLKCLGEVIERLFMLKIATKRLLKDFSQISEIDNFNEQVMDVEVVHWISFRLWSVFKKLPCYDKTPNDKLNIIRIRNKVLEHFDWEGNGDYPIQSLSYPQEGGIVYRKSGNVSYNDTVFVHLEEFLLKLVELMPDREEELRQKIKSQ